MRTVFILGLVICVGSTLFMSLVVLPMLFINMETSAAGGVAALLFPVYYWTGLGGAFLLLVASLALGRSGGRGWRAVTGAVMVMLVCQAYAEISIRPRMGEIRGVDSAVAEFQSLHERSVQLNTVVLVAGVLLVLGSGVLLRD
jgi:hypothetical protein